MLTPVMEARNLKLLAHKAICTASAAFPLTNESSTYRMHHKPHTFHSMLCILLLSEWLEVREDAMLYDLDVYGRANTLPFPEVLT